MSNCQIDGASTWVKEGGKELHFIRAILLELLIYQLSVRSAQ